MLAHDYVDMPGRSTEIGDNPSETAMLLRCRFCLKTPRNAREDGCPARELEENGSICLALWNPDGVEYFKGRKCVTCHTDIMGHFLFRGSDQYWCGARMVSEGIEGCVMDLAGVTVPAEPKGQI